MRTMTHVKTHGSSLRGVEPAEADTSEYPVRSRAFPAGRGASPPEAVSLTPDYLHRIMRLEAMLGNASGADKSWVHRAHADAVRHPSSAKRR